MCMEAAQQQRSAHSLSYDERASGTALLQAWCCDNAKEVAVAHDKVRKRGLSSASVLFGTSRTALEQWAASGSFTQLPHPHPLYLYATKHVWLSRAPRTFHAPWAAWLAGSFEDTSYYSQLHCKLGYVMLHVSLVATSIQLSQLRNATCSITVHACHITLQTCVI